MCCADVMCSYVSMSLCALGVAVCAPLGGESARDAHVQRCTTIPTRTTAGQFSISRVEGAGEWGRGLTSVSVVCVGLTFLCVYYVL